MPTVAPTSNQGLFTITSNAVSHAGSVGDVTMFMGPDVGTSLVFRLHQALGTRIAAIADPITRWGGKVVDFFIVGDGANLRVYVNGVRVTVTESTTGTPVSDWSASWAGAYMHTGIRQAGEYFIGSIYGGQLWNRAPSADEVRDLFNTRVKYADRWGSQTALAAGNFVVGKRYRIVTRTDGVFTSAGAANNSVGTEFVATAVATGVLDAGDTAVRIGVILDQPSILVGGTTIEDLSSNNLDATKSGGVNE